MQGGQSGEPPGFVQPEPNPLRQPGRVDVGASLDFGQQWLHGGDAVRGDPAAVSEVSPQIGPAEGEPAEVQPGPRRPKQAESRSGGQGSPASGEGWKRMTARGGRGGLRQGKRQPKRRKDRGATSPRFYEKPSAGALVLG